MFDNLKRIAIQKLNEKMASNNLGATETTAAAEEGAGALMESIQNKLAGGNISDVLDMFKGNNLESNSVFGEVTGKLASILESKGMSSEEAQGEAARTAPEVVDGLKEKFESNAEADQEFNLEILTSMVPEDLLNKAEDLLGGNASDLLNKAKSLF